MRSVYTPGAAGLPRPAAAAKAIVARPRTIDWQVAVPGFRASSVTATVWPETRTAPAARSLTRTAVRAIAAGTAAPRGSVTTATPVGRPQRSGLAKRIVSATGRAPAFTVESVAVAAGTEGAAAPVEPARAPIPRRAAVATGPHPLPPRPRPFAGSEGRGEHPPPDA